MRYFKELSLKFDPEVESSFRNYSSIKDKTYIRVAFILFAILYGFFSITDSILVPEYAELFFRIRFYFVIPVLLITIGITYLPLYLVYRQPILVVNFIIGGAGIVIMLLVDPLNAIYYGGLFLVFTSGYFMLNLHPLYATVGGVSVLMIFFLGVVITDQLTVTIFSVSVFLIAENIIGAIGAFQLERYKRNEFINNYHLNLSNNQLQSAIEDKTFELSKAQIATINALAKLAEFRDKETGEHIERVGALCHKLSEALPLDYFKSPEEKAEFTEAIRLASALHDIGKVGISDAILNKPSTLNDHEREIMRNHTLIGSQTLERIKEQYPHNVFINLGIEISKFHHEKWDGNGYPDGLKGFEIPLSARIMAIVDVYDALTSKRPYKNAISHDEAIKIMVSESGKHFDPVVLDCFLRITV